MMLSVPPLVTAPQISGPPCSIAAVIATISDSKRVAAGYMSRWSTFMCENCVATSPRNAKCSGPPW